MARGRRRTRTEVSLFPFLSVLACTIGALTLLITAAATSQVAAGGVDIERYELLEREIAANQRELASLEGLAREVETLGESVEGARERAQTLEAERGALAGRSAPDASLGEALRSAEARTRSLETQLTPLEARTGELRGELERRRKRLANAPIRIRPSGSGYGLVPQFIECRPEGIVLYEAPEWKGRPVPTYLVPTSPELTRFLQRVKFHDAGTVIFLVREGGVPAHDAAGERAARMGVRSGRMPLVGEGPLDFSAVSRS